MIKVGTFNLNNLFSRFNFSGAISELQSGAAGALTIRYEFTDPENIRVRTFLGRLVGAKKPADTESIAQRIIAMDLDVLAVQEVENVSILREFNHERLGDLYPFQVLIEGNDPRFIDVGLLSKLPIGSVTSFQTVRDPDSGRAVFSRDLVEIEIRNANNSQALFKIYNSHLKSHFGDDDNGGQGKQRNDARRLRQAEEISRIVAARNRTNGRFIVTGDMNDPPDAAPIAPLRTIEGNAMLDALSNPTETRPAKVEADGQNPPSAAWTHRFRNAGVTDHHLFDHIWLSSALAPRLQEAFIDRRTKHGGDGSDHDPAWVVLDV